MKEAKLREQLREIHLRRMLAGVISLAGIAAVIVGYIRYIDTSTKPLWDTYEELYLRQNARLPLRETYHPHATESIVVWIIGVILLAIGAYGIYYYTKKHGEVLDSFDE